MRTGYRQGQTLDCLINYVEKDGYAVTIYPEKLPGFLKTTNKYRRGDQVKAEFVCVHNGRLLLTQLFSGPRSTKNLLKQNTVNWEERRKEQENEEEETEKKVSKRQPKHNPKVGSSPPPIGHRKGYIFECTVISAEKNGYSVSTVKDHLPAFIKTSIELEAGDLIYGAFVCVYNGRLQLAEPSNKVVLKRKARAELSLCTPLESKEQLEEAEEDEAEDREHFFVCKRAVDMLPPPIDLRSMKEKKKFKAKESDLEWLITDLEGGRHTGCIKTSSSERLTRSAALLYQGRIVGCAHTNKQNPQTGHTEDALTSFLEELEKPDTEVLLYNLPKEVVASLSTLFLGRPLERKNEHSNMTAIEYYDYLLDWFSESGVTACLAVLANFPTATNLVMVHDGQVFGVFHVEDLKFVRDDDVLYEYMEKEPKYVVEASLLEKDRIEDEKGFGFSLSMANQRRKDSCPGEVQTVQTDPWDNGV